MNKTPILTVKDLNIEFHDHLIPETVVYDVDFELYNGEILGIVGESGSGKSMTAMAIAGLLSRKDMKKTGQILYHGQDMLTMKRQDLRRLQGKEIGFVFQEPMVSLNPTRKVGKQVEESLLIHTDLSKEERRVKMLETLEKVELSDPVSVAECYPHELSGGMRQRVMIASAIINNPVILIADEPTTALDVSVQSQIIDLLRKINKWNHTSILFISHDLMLVKDFCQRIVVMENGRVCETGEVKELFLHPEKEYTKRLIHASFEMGNRSKTEE